MHTVEETDHAEASPTKSTALLLMSEQSSPALNDEKVINKFNSKSMSVELSMLVVNSSSDENKPGYGKRSLI